MEDLGRRDRERLDHRFEQAGGLAQAIFGRAEDAVDQADHLLAGGGADQRAKLRFAEIGVADDDDAKSLRLGGAHQRDGRREGEAMARLGLQLALDGGVDLVGRCGGAQAPVDRLDPDLAAFASEDGALAGAHFGATAHPGADAGIGEDVDRSLGVAPDQGVEAVERQHAHAFGRAVEQGRDLSGSYREFHGLRPSRRVAGARGRARLS
jgi:hypothetical protein